MPEAGSKEEETFFMLDVIITVGLTAAQRPLLDVSLFGQTR
jgi:hypothetical protein